MHFTVFELEKILWQAGEHRGATVCIPYAGDECFSNYGEHYVPDGVTERVRPRSGSRQSMAESEIHLVTYVRVR